MPGTGDLIPLDLHDVCSAAKTITSFRLIHNVLNLHLDKTTPRPWPLDGVANGEPEQCTTDGRQNRDAIRVAFRLARVNQSQAKILGSSVYGEFHGRVHPDD